MWGAGQAESAALRPSGVVMSAAIAVTLTPVAARISAAVASMVARVRATMVRLTPSRARLTAQPLPSPLLAAQTRALLPAIPRSIPVLLPSMIVEGGSCVAGTAPSSAGDGPGEAGVTIRRL